jgi:hypothetical protein
MEEALLKECKVGNAADCKKEIANWEKYITDGGYNFDERAKNTAEKRVQKECPYKKGECCACDKQA